MKTKIIEWATLIFTHWKVILSILTLLGLVGGATVYAPQSAPEPPKVEPTVSQPEPEKVPVEPSVVVRPCYCLPLIEKHEKKFHFVD